MSSSELATYIADLMEAQNNLCKLTGLRMLLDNEHGVEALRCSLDRIDSDKHYEKGNLQLVCQFVNLWKNNTPNQDFIRLLKLVRSTSP